MVDCCRGGLPGVDNTLDLDLGVRSPSIYANTSCLAGDMILCGVGSIFHPGKDARIFYSLARFAMLLNMLELIIM